MRFASWFAVGSSPAGRSVIPAMTAHMINNAMAILVSRDVIPGSSDWIGANRGASLAIASALTASGIAILINGRRRE